MLRRLDTFNDLEVTLRNFGENDLEEPISITSLETFSLSSISFSECLAFGSLMLYDVSLFSPIS